MPNRVATTVEEAAVFESFRLPYERHYGAAWKAEQAAKQKAAAERQALADAAMRKAERIARKARLDTAQARTEKLESQRKIEENGAKISELRQRLSGLWSPPSPMLAEIGVKAPFKTLTPAEQNDALSKLLAVYDTAKAARQDGGPTWTAETRARLIEVKDLLGHRWARLGGVKGARERIASPSN